MEEIYRKRRIFLTAFLISSGIFIIIYIIISALAQRDLLEGPPFQPIDPGTSDAYIVVIVALIGLAGSCLASVVTIAGTIATTTIAIRREKREDRLAEV